MIGSDAAAVEWWAPGLLDLPSSQVCRAALGFVMDNEPTAIAHHSVRSFLFSRVLAQSDGADVDPELLFLACVLHDAGLSEVGNRGDRFEIDGADVAADLLRVHGLGRSAVEAVWDAIALHSSPGLAARRSVLCRLAQAGVLMDFGWNASQITDGQAMAIHRAYPRLGLAAELVNVIVGQAAANPAKAARYTMADMLQIERSGPHGSTRMERDEPHSRWVILEADLDSQR